MKTSDMVVLGLVVILASAFGAILGQSWISLALVM